MTDRAIRETQVAVIDRMMRNIAWHAQKQITHSLTHPQIDLTLPQLITLTAIYDHGSCRMSTLAEATQQSAGTLTGIVDRLIEDGLVERTRNSDDRRVVEVVLTSQGVERLRLAVDLSQEGTRRNIEMFSDEDIAQFQRLLDMVLAAVQNGHRPAFVRTIGV